MEFAYSKHNRTFVNNLKPHNLQASEAMAKNDISGFIKLTNAIKVKALKTLDDVVMTFNTESATSETHCLLISLKLDFQSFLIVSPPFESGEYASVFFSLNFVL